MQTRGDRLVSSTMASSSPEKPPSEATDAPSWAAWQGRAGFCPVSSCTLMPTSNNAKVLTATMKTVSHLPGVGDGAGLTEGTGTPSRNSMQDCQAGNCAASPSSEVISGKISLNMRERSCRTFAAFGTGGLRRANRG